MRLAVIALAFLGISCQQPASRYVVTEGHATVQAPIEFLTMSISIDVRNASLDQANRETRELVLKMFQIFKRYGLPDSSFVTLTNTSSNRNRSYDAEKLSEVTYSGELRGVEPRLYDHLFAELLALGDISISITSFQNTRLDQFNKQAYEQAVSNARKQAELLLSGTGSKVGRILKVLKTRENPFDEYDDFEKHIDKVTTPKPSVQYDMAAPNLESTYRRSTFDVSSSVNIMFEID